MERENRNMRAQLSKRQLEVDGFWGSEAGEAAGQVREVVAQGAAGVAQVIGLIEHGEGEPVRAVAGRDPRPELGIEAPDPLRLGEDRRGGPAVGRADHLQDVVGRVARLRDDPHVGSRVLVVEPTLVARLKVVGEYQV